VRPVRSYWIPDILHVLQASFLKDPELLSHFAIRAVSRYCAHSEFVQILRPEAPSCKVLHYTLRQLPRLPDVVQTRGCPEFVYALLRLR